MVSAPKKEGRARVVSSRTHRLLGPPGKDASDIDQEENLISRDGVQHVLSPRLLVTTKPGTQN